MIINIYIYIYIMETYKFAIVSTKTGNSFVVRSAHATFHTAMADSVKREKLAAARKKVKLIITIYRIS